MARRRTALFGYLDRYVLRIFTGAYVVAILMIVGLYMVIDLASNLDDYLRTGEDGRSNIGQVVRYYMLEAPFLYLQVAPFVTLIAGMFTVSRLRKSSEVIAALAAGISARRLLLPLFVAAVVLAGVMLALRESASKGIGFERDLLAVKLDEGTETVALDRVRLKDADGQTIYLESYFPAETAAGIGSRFEGLDAVRHVDGTWRVYGAASGTWRQAPGALGYWELVDGYQETVDDEERSREQLVQLETELYFEPSDVWAAWKGREEATELSFEDAASLAQRDPDNVQYRTLLYYLLTYPLANVLLLLCGLPFLMQYERGRGRGGMVAGFLLCVFYFGADFVSLNLGMQGQLSPLIATWLPPILFGSLGVVLFASTRS